MVSPWSCVLNDTLIGIAFFHVGWTALKQGAVETVCLLLGWCV